MRLGTTALAVALLAPWGASAQEGRDELRSAITGRVVDVERGRPVADVALTLIGTELRAETDDKGLFRIASVRPGRYVLEARHVGYAVRLDSLTVPVGALLDVTVGLATDPIELDELVVVVRSPVLDRHGFYGRQEQGYGATFIDRPTIEERNPETVTALFRNLPGMRVVYGGIHGSRVFMNQRVRLLDQNLPGCEPQLWLDGIRSTIQSYDMIRADEIEGIEVYSGGNAPGKFNDICGTVVIWTRVPASR